MSNSSAREMQPSHFMLISNLPCNEREKILQDAILSYSEYMLTCHQAKEELAIKLNKLFGIEEEETNDEQS
jgi:hypothetical protein